MPQYFCAQVRNNLSIPTIVATGKPQPARFLDPHQQAEIFSMDTISSLPRPAAAIVRAPITLDETRDEPHFSAAFGGRLVALSGAVGLDGLVNRAELLSPLLSGLGAGERLGLEFGITNPQAPPSVGLKGVVAARTAEEVIV